MSASIDRINTINEKFQTNCDENSARKVEGSYFRKYYISGQYRIASKSYSLIACLLGLVIATIDPIKTCSYFKI